jgi:DNA polymerase phi
MFPPSQKKDKKKKARKPTSAEEPDVDPDAPKPIDIFTDTVIGLLERSTTFMRVVATQTFAMLSDTATESTVDLILVVS